MLEQFEERAAILEYDEGMPRYKAETEAARRIGKPLWRVKSEIGERDTARSRDNGKATPRQPTNDVP